MVSTLLSPLTDLSPPIFLPVCSLEVEMSGEMHYEYIYTDTKGVHSILIRGGEDCEIHS